ncbi:MAG: TIM barrel protein [Eubacteriales bacterium]
MSILISGFSDEISDNFDEQLAKIKSLSMEYISLRGIDGKNIGDYSLEEFQSKVFPRLKKEGISVSSLSSPIGKIFIDDEAGFTEQVKQLETLCQIANLLECNYIRIFSFFIKKGENYDRYQDIVVEKIKIFAEISAKYKVILLHENEKDIFGDIVKRCHTLFKEVDSPYFQGIFDFANFVQCGENTLEAYDLLKSNILYYHIKDASYDLSYNVLCGTGHGKIPELVQKILDSGYEGFFTLEPHLAMFGSLQSLELEDASTVIDTSAELSGEEGFELQYKAFTQILSELGVKV